MHISMTKTLLILLSTPLSHIIVTAKQNTYTFRVHLGHLFILTCHDNFINFGWINLFFYFIILSFYPHNYVDEPNHNNIIMQS